MKKQFVAGLILILVTGCSQYTEKETGVIQEPKAMLSSLTDVSQGLSAYYPFNGDATDNTGNGHNGTVTGATLSEDRFGISGNSYSFDGIGDAIIIDNAIGRAAEFSYSVWVKLDPLPKFQSAENTIVQTGNGNIYYIPYSNKFVINIMRDRNGGADEGTATNYFYQFPNPLSPEQWGHIAFVAYLDNTAKFFVNGVEVAIGSRITDGGQLGDFNATCFGAGKVTNPESMNYSFTGSIDDISIFSKALTAEEVQQIYQREAVMVVNADLRIDPPVINKKSKGQYLTAYVELPPEYNVAIINPSSVLLNGTIAAEEHPTVLGDNDNDGIADLMVKFDRQKIITSLNSGEITVTGKLTNGMTFSGRTFIGIK
ncbi:MAG: hypothetical protein A2X42_03950 [Candidatus Margulisbacteria bacterium GWF2_38_17]|nr:MAG: hypothetical protein A2X43_00055 [Candidatus Margulisbacteria bacterium GWD2_39_127]OGI02237.1 MAG: hypothetical protein A2X42_03950 [Candidatus Margulisbacteria bacterium GWF2_38_17]OGI11471.1 MAG: hypothetical protein A2X41_05890 [Candidatus Margulisbacteria bacterium GWE2_39_32]